MEGRVGRGNCFGFGVGAMVDGGENVNDVGVDVCVCVLEEEDIAVDL